MEGCIIILAAGSSSRLGKPKQNVKLDGETLLYRVIDRAVKSKYQHVLVVLGSGAESLSRKVIAQNVDFVINEGWKEGMGSSIRVGVSHAIKKYNPNQIAISVVDQPYLSSEIFDKLYENTEKTSLITTSEYANGRLGVPAAFPKEWFELLEGLTGDKGAREIFGNTDKKIDSIEFPKGTIDIDLEEDLEAILDIYQ